MCEREKQKLCADPQNAAGGAIECLLGLSKGGFAGVGALSLPMLAFVIPPVQAAAKSTGEGDGAKAGTLREFKDSSERAYLVGKLRENGWNISKTAETIDTPRSNLYKKLEQYQISQETDG